VWVVAIDETCAQERIAELIASVDYSERVTDRQTETERQGLELANSGVASKT